METALKDAESDIVVAGYDIYTAIWKDLRGKPNKEAMLCHPRCRYDSSETSSCFAKIRSRSSEPPPFFPPLPISVLVPERFYARPHVLKGSFEQRCD
jgi:hypothetical protein